MFSLKKVSIQKLFGQGGSGSGYHGHEGRLGEQGGSQPESGGTSRLEKAKAARKSGGARGGKEISLTKKGFRSYDKRGNDLGGQSTTYFKGKIFTGDGIVVHRDGNKTVKEVEVISGYQRLGKPFDSIDEAHKYFTAKQPGY